MQTIKNFDKMKKEIVLAFKHSVFYLQAYKLYFPVAADSKIKAVLKPVNNWNKLFYSLTAARFYLKQMQVYNRSYIKNLYLLKMQKIYANNKSWLKKNPYTLLRLRALYKIKTKDWHLSFLPVRKSKFFILKINAND